MRKIFLITGILCALVLQSVAGQDEIREILQAMNARYSTADQFSVDIILRTFSDDVKMEISQGKVRYNGSEYYTRFANEEELYTQSSYISVDHDLNRIVFQPKETNLKDLMTDAAGTQQMDMSNLESLRVERLDNGKLKLSGFPVDYTMTGMEVILNPDYSLSQVITHYKEGSGYPYETLEISYVNTSFSPKFDQDYFSEDRFIQRQKKTLSPAPKFSHYQFYNLAKS